jgi:hypothetical protein
MKILSVGGDLFQNDGKTGKRDACHRVFYRAYISNNSIINAKITFEKKVIHQSFMFGIPVSVRFNLIKKSVTASSVISLYLESLSYNIRPNMAIIRPSAVDHKMYNGKLIQC